MRIPSSQMSFPSQMLYLQTAPDLRTKFLTLRRNFSSKLSPSKWNNYELQLFSVFFQTQSAPLTVVVRSRLVAMTHQAIGVISLRHVALEIGQMMTNSLP